MFDVVRVKVLLCAEKQSIRRNYSSPTSPKTESLVQESARRDQRGDLVRDDLFTPSEADAIFEIIFLCRMFDICRGHRDKMRDAEKSE